MDGLPEKRSLKYRKMIDVLMGNRGCADLILKGGHVINVVTREICKADLAVKNEYILMIGNCGGLEGPETEIIDVTGKYLSPGFLDAHMHFESSMLTCSEFSRLSLQGGTTTLFADPHEVANVLGKEGIRAMLEEARQLPNRILFTVPAQVPDVPFLETPGAKIDSREVKELLEEDIVQGIGEMQGFSNTRVVYQNDEALIDDLLVSSALAAKLHKTVEGNAPGLSGADLAAHIIVCGGETSCHETTTKEECLDKLRNGVTVFMREGSTQKNMAECIRAITEEGVDSRKLVLATDDMTAEDLLEKGHMNEVLRRTIEQNIDPVEAIQMATINPAQHYGRKDIGVLAPGKAADICVIGDLHKMRIDMVILGGKAAVKEGKLLLDIPPYYYPQHVKHSVKCGRIHSRDLQLTSLKTQVRVRGVGIIPEQNLTECVSDILPVKNGIVQPDTQKDLLPFAVIERHGKSGGIGKSFVRGLGLTRGAIAQSIGHDTHNLLVTGVDFEDMATAANRVRSMEGGIAIILEGKVIGELPLPVAGLINDELGAEELSGRLKELGRLAGEALGCRLKEPFMHLSFLTLVTSPEWKLTDYGLVDVPGYRLLHTLEEESL